MVKSRFPDNKISNHPDYPPGRRSALAPLQGGAYWGGTPLQRALTGELTGHLQEIKTLSQTENPDIIAIAGDHGILERHNIQVRTAQRISFKITTSLRGSQMFGKYILCLISRKPFSNFPDTGFTERLFQFSLQRGWHQFAMNPPGIWLISILLRSIQR